MSFLQPRHCLSARVCNRGLRGMSKIVSARDRPMLIQRPHGHRDGNRIWVSRREEKAAQKQVREAAKRGDMASARLIAKELVRTRRAVTQLYTNKAHMISMGTQLQEQMAIVKVAGTLKKSTEVMKIVNDMMKVRCTVRGHLCVSRSLVSRRSFAGQCIDSMKAFASVFLLGTAGARHERDHDGAQQRDDEGRHHRRGA